MELCLSFLKESFVFEKQFYMLYLLQFWFLTNHLFIDIFPFMYSTILVLISIFYFCEYVSNEFFLEIISQGDIPLQLLCFSPFLCRSNQVLDSFWWLNSSDFLFNCLYDHVSIEILLPIYFRVFNALPVK